MAADGSNFGDGPKNTTTDPGSNIAIGQIVLGAVVGIIFGVVASHFIHPPPPAPPSAPPKVRTTHYHYAPNGIRDVEWRYKNGRLVSRNVDRNLDGSFDYWVHYDAEGNVTSVEEDNNFDGKPDEFVTYSDNEITGIERDTDFNGVPDEFLTYREHLPQQLDIKPNGSKFTTVRQFYSNGVTTEIWSGGDSNGNFREKVAYDPFFNPIHTNVLFYPLLAVPGH
jgi:hypothetical protein